MTFISVPLPKTASYQDIEVDIRVNGQLLKQNFRVEIFYWKDCESMHNRAECIRQILSSYDEAWQLYYIGAPTQDFVPITFMKKIA